MKIISNLVIYYMSKIEISLYNHIVTVSYIGRKSTGDPTKPKIEIGKYDQDGYFMNEYSLEFMRNNIYEFDLSDSSLDDIANPLGIFQTDGTTSYSTGVTQTGTPGSPGAKLTFTVPSDAPGQLKLVDSFGRLNISINIVENTNIDKAFKSYYVDNKSIFRKTEYHILYDADADEGLFTINNYISGSPAVYSPVPNLELVRGDSYVFDVEQDGGVPFRLRKIDGSVYAPSSSAGPTEGAFVRYDIPFDAPDTLYNGTQEIKVVNKTIVLQKDIGPITDTGDSIIIDSSVTFEGNNHTITLNATNFTGLFDLQGGTIQNLKVTSSNANDSTIQYGGWIVGKEGFGTVKNCSSNGKIGNYGGGIVGSYFGFGQDPAIKISTISNCFSTGLIKDNAGGIVGSNACANSEKNNLFGKLIIENCYSTGQIGITNGNAGGIAGLNTCNAGSSTNNNAQCIIRKCFSSGKISKYSGGILGAHSGYDNNGTFVEVRQCYAIGDMMSGTDLFSGGIVGFASKNVQVYNSYYTGTFNGTGTSGIIAKCEVHSRCSVTNCYSTGIVNKSNNNYGIYYVEPGTTDGHPITITNSYSNGSLKSGPSILINCDSSLLSITDKTRVDTDSIMLNTNIAVESHSDNNSPTIAIGNDGVLYLFYGGESQILYFKKSTDKGVTWSDEKEIWTGGYRTGPDGRMAISVTGSGATANVFLAWGLPTSIGSLAFAYSINGGSTFQFTNGTGIEDPTTVGGAYVSMYAKGTVGTDAKIYISYQHFTTKETGFIKLINSGSWPSPNLLSIDNTANSGFNTSISVVPDGGSTNIFITYSKFNSGSDKIILSKSIDDGSNFTNTDIVSESRVYPNNPTSIFAIDKDNIYVIYNDTNGQMIINKSVNGGSDWISPISKIGTNVTGINDLAVTGSGADTNLFISYFETINNVTKLRLAYSTNNGASWKYHDMPGSGTDYVKLASICALKEDVYIARINSNPYEPRTEILCHSFIIEKTFSSFIWEVPTAIDTDIDIYPRLKAFLKKPWYKENYTAYDSSVALTGSQFFPTIVIDETNKNTYFTSTGDALGDNYQYVVLSEDITLSSTTNYMKLVAKKDGNNHPPSYFSKQTFDGDSLTITIYVEKFQGLFELDHSFVKNLKVNANPQTLTCDSYCAWIAKSGSSGEITYSSSTGNIGTHAGGIAASKCVHMDIEDCYSTGDIGDYGGGIIGDSCTVYSNDMVKIKNSYSTGSIGKYAGGIAGAYAGTNPLNSYDGNNNFAWKSGCRIQKSYSSGDIDEYGGGIAGAYAGEGFFYPAGTFSGSPDLTSLGAIVIEKCFSRGKISSSAGGILGAYVGLVDKNKTGLTTLNEQRNGVNVEYCYAIGDMLSTSNNAGGLVGGEPFIVKVKGSYYTGKLNGIDAGGILGNENNKSFLIEVENSYSTSTLDTVKEQSGIITINNSRLQNRYGTTNPHQKIDIKDTFSNGQGISGVIPPDVSLKVVTSAVNGSSGNGHVKIYHEDPTNWRQIGTTTEGEVANDRFGNSIAMSYDSSIIVVGAPNHGANNNGEVYIYSGTDYATKTILECDSSNFHFGEHVCANGDGSVIGVGSSGTVNLNSRNNVTSYTRSRVQIYKNVSGNWIPKGAPILGLDNVTDEIYRIYDGGSNFVVQNGTPNPYGAPPTYTNIYALKKGHKYIFNIGTSSDTGNHFNYPDADPRTTELKFEVKDDETSVYEATVANGRLIKTGDYGTAGSTLTFVVPNEIVEYNVIKITGTTKNSDGGNANYDYDDASSLTLTESTLNDSCMIVDIDEKGDRIIVGAPAYNNNNGLCRVFDYKVPSTTEWNETAYGGTVMKGTDTIQVDNKSYWVRKGSPITLTGGARLGTSVSISSDGQVIAMGTPWKGESTERKGGVKLMNYGMDWNLTPAANNWIDYGNQNILYTGAEAPNNGDLFGTSVSLNNDGSVIAVGAPLVDDSSSKGYVKVFELPQDQFGSSNWQLRGSVITSSSNTNFGHSVDLNFTGDIVAIGAPYESSNKGRTRVYRYSSNSWGEIHSSGTNLEGANSNDLLGWSVVLNKNAGRTYLTRSNENDTLTNITNTLPSDWASETMDGISPDIPQTFYYFDKIQIQPF